MTYGRRSNSVAERWGRYPFRAFQEAWVGREAVATTGTVVATTGAIGKVALLLPRASWAQTTPQV